MAERKPRSALVGLGSNQDAARNLARARGALAAHFHVRALSRELESPASGGGAGDYRNQLVRLETDLEVDTLRAALKRIEADLGRVRGPGAPVAIDLDLLALSGEPDAPELAAAPYWVALRATFP
ncbi:MAG: 2-amino-4-hydroxy-6-hydroxymethyldihydropteridine diphosphokinase [Planctomycetota bacterium]